MTERAAAVLTYWGMFYTLIGTAAATLIGLMFIVITLVMGTNRVRRSRTGISTFSTPTVVHFGAALIFSATLLVPWHMLLGVAIILGLGGLMGLIYVVRLFTRQYNFSDYEPDAEDWIWYTTLPIVAYAAVVMGAVIICLNPTLALSIFAATTTLLLVIGIHNSWDIVTYITISEGKDDPPDTENPPTDTEEGENP